MKNNSPAEKKKPSPENELARKKTNDLFRKKQMRIIKKATQLFTKKGYAQTSMREISKVTGIDLGNLYYFIESKEEILFLAFDMIHSPAANIFNKHGIFDIADPEVQLRTAIRELAKINYQYKDEILLLYRESKILPKHFLKIILKRENQLVGHFEEILRKIAELKPIAVEDYSFTANLIVYQSSFYPLRKWNLKRYTQDEVADLTENSIMRAILA